MKNYSEMSDFEINKAVAIAEGYPPEDCDYGWTGKPDVGVEWSEKTGYPTKSFNYCNSWADAGPIIEKSRISLRNRIDGNWMAENEWGISFRALHDNPLRAAMIVFLMMRESK